MYKALASILGSRCNTGTWGMCGNMWLEHGKEVQWSLYFKTTHGIWKRRSFLASVFIRGSVVHNIKTWDQIKWSYKVVLNQRGE